MDIEEFDYELPGELIAQEPLPEREHLEKRIAELGLADRVFLLGHRLDVPAILARVQTSG